VTSSPLADPPTTCERPHGHISKSNNDVWLDEFDFFEESIEAFLYVGVDVEASEFDEATGDVLASLVEPDFDLVVWGAMAADICGETLGAHEASFVEHLVEFAATCADERVARPFFFEAGGFPYEHDAGGDWTFARDLHLTLKSRGV
jgi:hypothetical protein